jgi:hypothetical protein
MLIIPLFKLGSVLFGEGAIIVNLADIIGKMNADLLGTIREYLLVTLHAICVWGLLAPFMIALFFYVMLPLFTRLELKYVRISADI